MLVCRDSRHRVASFVDSSLRARFVYAAATVLALAGVNLLFVADRFADVGQAASSRQLWLYLQYSLDFTVLAMVFYAGSFLAWFYRAYRNLLALSDDATEWHILWVFAGWVLPVINLLFPYLLLREIGWKSSGPQGPPGNWSRSLLLWWALFLLSQTLLAAYWQFIATVGFHAPPAAFAAGIGPRLPEIAFAHMLFGLDALLSGWLIAKAVAMQRRKHDNPAPPATGFSGERTLYY